MLLPTKYIPLKDSMLMAGGTVLALLIMPQTVTKLWLKARKQSTVETFDRFCLALDFLFTLGLVSFENGLIIRRKKHDTP